MIADVAMNGKVGMVVMLHESQLVLASDCKGDGSLAWIKTLTSKGELFVALVYGGRRRNKRVILWNLMENNLPTGQWLICGHCNHTKFIEDSVGPTPLLHGLERHSWNHLMDKFDLIDNRLIVVIKYGLYFTRQAMYGDHLDQSWLNMSYSSDRGH